MTVPSPGRDVATWGWREALAVVVGSWVALAVGGSVVLVALGYEPGDDITMSGQFLATVPFWLAAIGGVVWLSRRDPSPSAALGLAVRPPDVLVGAACGVALQLAVLPVVYWPILQVLDRDYDDVERAARELADSATGAVGVILFVLMASVIAPVVEELLYRGLLLRAAGWAPGVALGVSSVVFAASHLQGLQFPGLLLVGVLTGVLVQRTGRIAPAIAAHVAFNTTSVVQLLAHR